MPYSDVGTKSVGAVLPASHINGLRSNQQYFSGGFPHCNIKETTAQSVATATWVALVSDEEVSDIGGMHSVVTNSSRVTIPASEGGLYLMGGVTLHTANATGNRFMGFGKNGAAPVAAVASAVGSAAIDQTLSGTQTMLLDAGDYVECKAYHTVGVNLNVQLIDFWVMWIATV